MQRWEKTALITLFLTISIAALLNIFQEITYTGFIGEQQSFVNYYVETGQASLFNSPGGSGTVRYDILSTGDTLWGLTIHYISLSLITGLKAQSLMLLPFGVLFTALGYHVLFGEIFDRKIGMIALFYICIYVLNSTDRLGGYVSAFSTILFFLLIFSIVKIIRGCSNDRWFFTFLLFYIGLFSIWHTMESRALFFIFGTAAILGVMNLIGNSRSLQILPYAVLAFVITIYFKEWLFAPGAAGYFSQVSPTLLIQSYVEAVSSLIGSIIDGAGPPSTPWYSPVSANPFGTISSAGRILLYLSIAAPIGVAALVDIKKIITSRSLGPIADVWSMIMWSLIAMKGAHLVAYGLIGGAGPGMILTVMVVGTIIATQKLTTPLFQGLSRHDLPSIRQRYAPMVVFWGLVLLMATTSLSPMWGYIANEEASYQELESGTDWYVNYASESEEGLSPFETRGKIMTIASSNGDIPQIATLGKRDYIHLAAHNRSSEWGYLIYETERTSPMALDQLWEQLRPLNHISEDISSDHHLAKVYADGSIAVHKSVQ
jgi:hypothetical protein